jgi:tripartite-type tricarboxylate transporter receptor subunit TctC
MLHPRSLLALVLLALPVASALAAEAFPTRSLTMVVPYAAGGPTDTVSRLVAEAMGNRLGQQIVVENVAGAGGTLGAQRVAEADPDGYTLLMHHIAQATSPSLYRRLPYDPATAFAPIGLVTEAPMTPVARPGFPPASIAELLAYMRERKDGITYANAGLGGASHICGMLLMSTLDVKLTTVPYKGTGPAMTDLLGGQVDMMCDQPPTRWASSRAAGSRAMPLQPASECPRCRIYRPWTRPALRASRSPSGTGFTHWRARPSR